MTWNFFGTVRQWHWISSALCLAALLLFAVTGFTLNHATSIESRAQTTEITDDLPANLLRELQQADDNLQLPEAVVRWLGAEHNINVGNRDPEWSDVDIYVSMPRPGGDAWLSIDLTDGFLLYENTSRGWVAYLNDLHKGRHTSLAWSWFIDVTALACVVFAITGLVLLKRQASQRRTTWPLTSLGFVIPIVLLLLFSH